ncbi:MAG TPA: prepilin-type N-terminal cleavage/methylation domain-containing protein [Acidimicrobiales bacterium]
MPRREEGFTLLELMVVVLVISIILAIAIPTFLGARRAAWDRAAQSNVRNAHTNLMTYYADGQVFTEDTTELTSIDPSVVYETVTPAALTSENVVFIEVRTTSRPDDTLYVAGMSGTGVCYWLRTIGDENHPRFASNDCQSVPADAAFLPTW